MSFAPTYLPKITKLTSDAGDLQANELRNAYGFFGLEDEPPRALEEDLPGLPRRVNLVSKSSLS